MQECPERAVGRTDPSGGRIRPTSWISESTTPRSVDTEASNAERFATAMDDLQRSPARPSGHPLRRRRRAMRRQTAMSAGAAATLPRMTIRPAEDRDSEARAGFLERWHSLRVARLGALEHPLDHPTLVAERDGRLVGALTYVVRGA